MGKANPPSKKAEALKPGWKVWRFDEVATNVNTRVDNPSESGMEHYVGLEHLDADSLKIRRWGTPDDVESTKLYFKVGDIIFGKRRAYQRKLGVAEFDGICSAHALVLRAKPAVVLPEFLPFFMKSDLFMNRAVEISVGSLSPTINWKTLAAQEFSIPPIEEQRVITEVLRANLECFDSYLSLEMSIRELLLSQSLALFSDVAQDIGAMKKIGEIAEVQYGLTINAKRRDMAQQLPYLRVANVQRFSLDLSEVKDVGVEPRDESCALKGNDILVVEGHADINELGRAAMWDDQLPVCLHQNHLIRIRCVKDVDPYYVLEYVNSPAGRSYFRARGKSTSGLNTLNSTVVREMPIPVPPLQVQFEIAHELRQSRQALESVILKRQKQGEFSKRLNSKTLGGAYGE